MRALNSDRKKFDQDIKHMTKTFRYQGRTYTRQLASQNLRNVEEAYMALKEGRGDAIGYFNERTWSADQWLDLYYAQRS